MSNVIQPAAPVAVLVNRIKWHIDAGNVSGLLHGLKYKPTPEWNVEGSKDLPNLSIIDFNDDEGTNTAGAKTGTAVRSNTVVWPTQSIIFMLVTKRANGLYADPSSATRGLLDWITYIRDAMEIRPDGTVDALLNDTCVKPFETKTRDNVVRELSWSCGIEVTLYPRETPRGTRKDDMAT